MKTIGFGIIGIGRQGLRLAEHIRKDIDHGKLVAVCRRSDSGHAYSKEHGIKFYSNHLDLLADEDINAVIITTPSSLHGTQTIEALKFKKHVLVDKPMASTLEEAQQILDISKKDTLTVAVNFPLRVNPVTSALKNNLKQIGNLRKIQVIVSHGPVRSSWQSNFKLSSGGVIMDLGSHYFDLIFHITGCHPEAVVNAYSEDAEIEQSGFVVLTYKDFSASVVLLRNQKLKKSIITCAGDRGFILADYVMREVIVSNHDEVNEIKCPASNDFKIILNNFVYALNKKKEVIANAEAGMHSLQTALLAYRAIKSGKPIR